MLQWLCSPQVRPLPPPLPGGESFSLVLSAMCFQRLLALTQVRVVSDARKPGAEDRHRNFFSSSIITHPSSLSFNLIQFNSTHQILLSTCYVPCTGLNVGSFGPLTMSLLNELETEVPLGITTDVPGKPSTAPHYSARKTNLAILSIS